MFYNTVTVTFSLAIFIGNVEVAGREENAVWLGGKSHCWALSARSISWEMKNSGAQSGAV
jgi:hypothetical protein